MIHKYTALVRYGCCVIGQINYRTVLPDATSSTSYTSNNRRGGHVKSTMALVLFASILLVGCGNATQTTSPPSSSSTDGVQPPKASVTIGSQQIQTVINGYQWSDGNHSSIADAASDPAKKLKKYDAMVGEKVTLSFDQKPKSVQLTMWSNGKQASTSALSNPSFSLPSQAGDYTYEVTGHWSNDYVNYDFEVQVH